jgi:molecular chaperone DnaJ
MAPTNKRDYYEVLGLKRGVGADELKKSFRTLAFKFHPDRNQGDKAAEASFKEVSEAYEVLSDPQRRKLYDLHGHAGLDGQSFRAPEDIFEQFQDLFADFFGGGFGAQRPTSQGRRASQGGGPRAVQGRDLRTGVRISFRDAVLGAKHEINVAFPMTCPECTGRGTAKGTSPVQCAQCRGRGQVQASSMGFLVMMPCNACRGRGEVITTPCPACSGAGEIRGEKKVKVAIPAGIDHGQAIRLQGQGEPGAHGGPAGNLLVAVEVEPDPNFQRDGMDLAMEVPVSFATAALGGAIEVLTLDDHRLKVDLPPGTQSGATFRYPNEGVPQVGGGGRGDLHVVVRVEVPRKLNERARKALRDFDRALRDED